MKILQQIGHSNQEIVKLAQAFQPDLTGFSCMTYNFTNGLALARDIRKETGSRIVFGGYHVTAAPEVEKNLGRKITP